MNFIDDYKKLDLRTEDAVFDYLLLKLKETIRTHDFFVAWEKVLSNVGKIEVPLNILNTLIGKSNVSQELRTIIKNYPEVVPVFPILIAVRDKSIKIANISGDHTYTFKEKKSYTIEEIEDIVTFATKSGLLEVLEDKKIKNLVDYALGVEVGLDTNARKNRSGTAMENLVEVYIKSICDKNGLDYIVQATASEIKARFNRSISTDKADRRFDFAINTKEKIFLIEVNYYGGGGSKLKSVAGEFSSLYKLVKSKHTEFIWITDGKGWETAKKPLRETFNVIDYIFNIEMVANGLLENVLKVS